MLEDYMAKLRRQWLLGGISAEDCEELESHFIDLYEDISRRTPHLPISCLVEQTAEQFGNPLAANYVALSPPSGLRWSFLYVWCFAIATVLNELLLWGNGTFEWYSLGIGVLCCYGAYQLTHYRKRWLNIWLMVNSLLLPVLLALIVAVFMAAFSNGAFLNTASAGEAGSLLRYFFVGIGSLLLTGWQLRVFHKAEYRYFFN
jgi:hypothetical protein